MQTKIQQNQTLSELKTENKDRVEKGLQPTYQKKRDIKNKKYEKQFDQLQKDGRLEKFLQNKSEDVDKKRNK